MKTAVIPPPCHQAGSHLFCDMYEKTGLEFLKNKLVLDHLLFN